MCYPTIYLMRHGQTVWNKAGRLQGWLDSPLTEQGIQDAQAQGRLLQPLLERHPQMPIYSSPQGRALRTARLALGPSPREIHQDDRLREISAGSWNGKTLVDIEETWPALFESASNAFELMFYAPDGEGAQAVETRLLSFLGDLKGPTAIFTHGATMSMLRGLLCDIPFHERLNLGQEQGCIYKVDDKKSVCIKE